MYNNKNNNNLVPHGGPKSSGAGEKETLNINVVAKNNPEPSKGQGGGDERITWRAATKRERLEAPFDAAASDQS